MKKQRGRPKASVKNKQVPVAFEAENLAFLERIRESIGHGRWSFTATVNFAIEQLRTGKGIEGV